MRIKNWRDLAKWYDWHGWHECARAAYDPKSDLRRYGRLDLIVRAIEAL